MVKRSVHAAVVLMFATTFAMAEAAKPSPKDAAAVQACLTSDRGAELDGERCIGVVADPCLDTANSTADMNDCSTREHRVWDALLNNAYGQVRGMLDAEQQIKLRDMQRAWIASRDKTCQFYWDFHQGSIASPMAAYCMVRETARRTMFLRRFLKG
jgi:uncharacterized protein YecT (DUF1311 family)